MATALRIRRYQDQDATASAQLFFEAVQTGARDAYTQDQRNAWAPSVPDISQWHDRLKMQFSLMAYQNEQLSGFMTLTEQGVIDLAFVRPTAMGKGVAGELYDAILKQARIRQFSHLETHASHQARRFFEKRNWTVIQQQIVVRDDVELTNFLMELKLTSAENSD
jgi:putative acetyltransferase